MQWGLGIENRDQKIVSQKCIQLNPAFDVIFQSNLSLDNDQRSYSLAGESGGSQYDLVELFLRFFTRESQEKTSPSYLSQSPFESLTEK